MLLNELASDLAFPEGPIAMDDGSVLVVEIARGTLTRVSADGAVDVVAQPGGGPNGAAIGPNGLCYVCNNGGFDWHRASDGRIFPGNQPADYSGGRIERIDIQSGETEVLYDACEGERLKGPNDIVFDREGGFWFTDHGKNRSRDVDRTGVFYALADGSMIREEIFPMESPNGIGLSPDEKTLYVAETPTGRLWAYALSSAGVVDKTQRPKMMAQLPDYHMFDSLAVDAEGNICVATLITGGITVHAADGESAKLIPMPDVLTTNICFGGKDLKTAFITLSSTGKLVSCEWDVSGLALNFLNA